jgi:zinc transporter
MLGMNLAGIPFADSPYAFWTVAAGLTVAGAAIVLWMKRQRWL